MSIRNRLVSSLFWVLLFVVVAPTSTWAASVTTSELSNLKTGMDGIYSQSTFGSNPIQIRFNAIQTVNGPTSVNSSTDWNTLLGFAGAPPTVFAFFVDAINWCGSAGNNIVGCAGQPGNALMLDSGFVAANQTGNGFIDFAHELGHNLDLAHVSDTTNLMNATLLGGTTLTATQVSTIYNSPLIQTDSLGKLFISITPIVVVPLPAAWILLLSAMGMMGIFGGKRSTRVV